MNTDIKEIAEQLDVGHILEGSVRKAGNRVRVTAQLIDVSTDTHLWSETYDRELEDIFAIQDEIAGHIVSELELVLGPEQMTARSAQPTQNLSAYESYLRGRYLFLQRGVASLAQAVESFQAAVDKDPDFADAWAALAQASITLGGWDPANAASHIAGVEAAAQKALELDPQSATALSTLGMMHFNRLEWAQALEYMTEAAAVARDSTPIYWYGLILQSAGYLDEAARQLEIAERMDPIYPQLQFGLGLSALDRNEVEKARRHMQRAIDGNNPNGYYGLSIVSLMQRDADGIRASIESLFKVFDDGVLTARDPDRQAIETVLAALDESGDKALGIEAAVLTGQISVLKWLGAEAEILGFLQTLLESGRHVELSTALGQSIWIPAFAEVRQLPGFKPFLKETGLVDLWRERGWPDLCRPAGEEGFICD
jgi:tetratricopeptide (TPR) repeat protein